MEVEAPPASAPSAYDDYLATPKDTDMQHDQLQRSAANILHKNEDFRLPKRQYHRQYAQLYFSRLSILEPSVREQARTRWPGVPMAKILELEEGKEVVVVGTVYKQMRLKPSILEEYTPERGARGALAPAVSFCSEDDSVVLEDEGARMVLRGDALPVQRLVTGVIMAVRGYNEPGGDFLVSDVCFAGLAPQAPLPSPPSGAEDKYVALLSGLHLGSSRADALRTQLLVDMLTGALGSRGDQKMSAKVAHVIVAGGSIGAMEPLAAAVPYSRQFNFELQPLRDLDMALAELAESLPVDVMPGADDPANVSLPQQPLHKCLFPGAARYGSFSRVTNPHRLEVEGVTLLGTAGQNIDDMALYSSGRSRLDMMEDTLEWQHMAPTAPDTLTCYPFGDRDPFLVREAPHVYFVGNQPEFGAREVTGPAGQVVRVVAVPAFADSGTVVLLNLRTLQCHPVTFGAAV